MLNDLNNDSSATIDGEQNVGGIAGQNDGTINVNKQSLINKGTINGQENVGGIAGNNTGTIDGEGLTNEIELHVKDTKKDTKNPANNFGGVAGKNSGTIIGAYTSDKAKLTVDTATNVGGIVGENSGTIKGTIENNGEVAGKDFVGGIVGNNTDKAKFEANSIIKNNGKVTSGNSAGGIIGQNNAALSGVIMENNDDVTGADSVGGIIGVNSDKISNSSLYNTIKGTIKGTNNIGGIIGTNSGEVIGGRDNSDNYYQHRIYNNGSIIATQNNAGGLIGNNTGSLTAGYNTGSVNGATNVGGIAGTNSGTVDQVFNTLANNQTIKGDTNVGGLIGENAGTLSNAYNSTDITANTGTHVGNAVGNNSATGKIAYVYGVSDNDTLIGEKALIANDESNSGIDTNNVFVFNADKATQTENYPNYAENIWKFQDGHTSPLLKAFLTKLNVILYEPDNIKGKFQNFVAKAEGNNVYIYKADAQGNIRGGRVVGYIQAVDPSGVHNLVDYLNTKSSNTNNLITSVLSRTSSNSDIFYSHQINTNHIDPNNLGFDFEVKIEPFANFDYLYQDGWGRKRNFRERRAEFNYVTGGTKIAEKQIPQDNVEAKTDDDVQNK